MQTRLFRALCSIAFGALVLAFLHITPTHASALAPRDIAYPGTITLHVDATDLDRRIFRMRETIPVKAGPLTLYYPQWIPGHHAPTGAIEALAGLTIHAKGDGNASTTRLDWTRDPLDVYAFNVSVPRGTTQLELEFQFASPTLSTQAGALMTPDILGVHWEKLLLYPAGHYSNRIPFAPRLTVPKDWQVASALDIERRESGQAADSIRFRTTFLETLVDSPLFAGNRYKRVDLDADATNARPGVPVRLNLFADSSAELDITPEQLAPHRKLIQETDALFNSRHFDRYEFLLAISANFATGGLEHHRSSNNSVRSGYFKEWDKTVAGRFLLPHEYVHSWVGKFRRPADLTTPNLNTPMQDSLVWVYEGMTEYYGQVLTARSGLWTEDETRSAIAMHAANLQECRQGRVWRNLQDTTNQPIITLRRPLSWVSWQRSEDYYREGALVWLDVDTKLRELTDNQRSLDDFSRAFYGINGGSYVPLTYTFDDVVKSLNSIAPFDWANFLRSRLQSTDPGAPLEGLERSGWKLVYKGEPSDFYKRAEAQSEATDLSYSIGATLNKDTQFTDIVWDSPAFKAGLASGTTLVAVNGRAYQPDVLRQAVNDTRKEGRSLELLVKTLDRYRTVTITYRGGLRYPHLERIEGRPDRLAEILKPRT